MGAATFDALAYFEKLKEAGVPEAQAKIQANAFRDFSALQEEKSQRDLATKGDIANMRGEMRETELRLQKEMREIETRLLKWQLGVGLALAAIMAKGFGWLGF